MASANTMDLTEGSVLKKIISFSVPIALGNLLQQLYTAADRIVVGQFAEDGATALAAIGATASPINLIIGLFLGIAIGNNVICANLLGARNREGLRKCMHTSVLTGVICGLFILLFGILTAPMILRWMDTPDNVMGGAVMYMQLFYLGMPASLLYNIGAGILRAHGDTKRPMYILVTSGLVNVIFNLVLVMIFHLDVAGVAIATTISHLLSAGAMLAILFSRKDQYKLTLKELKIDKAQLIAVIRIGVPSGLGSVVFSASNVIIQSAVNSFGSAAIIAAKTAATDINNLVYQFEAALLAACVSFSGQCYGARNYKRIDRVAITAALLCVGIMALSMIPCALFAPQMIRLFNQESEVVDYGSRILTIFTLGMIAYAPAEPFCGCSRGMRRALMPTVLNIVAICGTRILWLLCVFPTHHTIDALYLCYPASWLLSSIVQILYYFHARRKLSQQSKQ